MKVIFRSNDSFARKTLGQLGGAQEWLTSLEKYLSESAIARLSLFVEENTSLATLDIIDGKNHVYSSYKDSNVLTAVETVITKCANQLNKNQIDINRDSIKYETIDEYNDCCIQQFELLEIEENLNAEKSTPKYIRIMNKYINYLYRESEIEHANDQLRILYSIYDNLDYEFVSVADYNRLLKSIVQIEKEINSMLQKQKHFETGTKDENYINYIIEEESKLAKLKG